MIPPPRKGPVSTADLIVSVLALVLMGFVGVSATVMGFFLLAFLDSCPAATCSADDAVTAIGTALVVALVIGIVGVVVTVVQLVRRKPAWPFAIGALVLSGTSCLFGVAGYFSAVGA